MPEQPVARRIKAVAEGMDNRPQRLRAVIDVYTIRGATVVMLLCCRQTGHQRDEMQRRPNIKPLPRPALSQHGMHQRRTPFASQPSHRVTISSIVSPPFQFHFHNGLSALHASTIDRELLRHVVHTHTVDNFIRAR
jgi:hypothetical protein